MTSKLVQVHDTCHIGSHDVSWEPVISLQKPGVVLLDKLSILCVGPESVLPSRMHFPTTEIYSCDPKPRVWAVHDRNRAGCPLKLLLSMIMRLLLQCCRRSEEKAIRRRFDYSLHGLLPAPELQWQSLHLP